MGGSIFARRLIDTVLGITCGNLRMCGPLNAGTVVAPFQFLQCTMIMGKNRQDHRASRHQLTTESLQLNTATRPRRHRSGRP
jgi:hypothetical protein